MIYDLSVVLRMISATGESERRYFCRYDRISEDRERKETNESVTPGNEHSSGYEPSTVGQNKWIYFLSVVTSATNLIRPKKCNENGR